MTVRLTRQIGKGLAIEFAVFAAGAGGIALWHSSPLLLSALLVALAAVAIGGVWPGRDVLVLYLMGAIVGPCGEMIGASSGAWRYAEPTLLGIPLWLPLAWGLAAVLIRGVSETLAKMVRGDSPLTLEDKGCDP
jgi:hypothetical protein